jgi:hypothetical protein
MLNLFIKYLDTFIILIKNKLSRIKEKISDEYFWATVEETIDTIGASDGPLTNID